MVCFLVEVRGVAGILKQPNAIRVDDKNIQWYEIIETITKNKLKVIPVYFNLSKKPNCLRVEATENPGRFADFTFFTLPGRGPLLMIDDEIHIYVKVVGSWNVNLIIAGFTRPRTVVLSYSHTLCKI